MKKLNKKSLQLTRETVRTLDRANLDQVAGGVLTDLCRGGGTQTCYGSMCGCQTGNCPG